MIVLDLETSGLDPRKNAILSIGALNFDDPSQNFYRECRIWDGAEIEQAALKINGFSEAQIKNLSKPTQHEVLKEFISWADRCPDRTLAGENPSFDRDFLMFSIARCGLEYHFGYRTIDLHTLAFADHFRRKIEPPIRNGRTNIILDTILTYVGLPPEPRPHNALAGALCEAEAFSRLLNHKPLLVEFSKCELPYYLTDHR